SDRRYRHRGVLSRLFSRRPFADAQIHALGFGALALVILLAISASEWTRTFVTVVTELEASRIKVVDELRSVDLSAKTVARQLTAVDGLPKGPNSDVLRESLAKQQDELNARR